MDKKSLKDYINWKSERVRVYRIKSYEITKHPKHTYKDSYMIKPTIDGWRIRGNNMTGTFKRDENINNYLFNLNSYHKWVRQEKLNKLCNT